MFGIGETELLIIVAFAFMVFGPDKLPGMGRTIGRALRQFREAQEDFTQVVQAEVVDPLNDALNEPSAKRRAQEAASAVAEDADIDDTTAAPRRKETFAERKARLQAERAAREAADQAGGAGPSSSEASGAGTKTDEDAVSGTSAASAAQVVSAQPPEAATPAPSAAALYALSARQVPSTPVATAISNGPTGDAGTTSSGGEEDAQAE